MTPEQKKPYIIVEAPSKEYLENRVAMKIREGYEPVGAMSFDDENVDPVSQNSAYKQPMKLMKSL